MGVWGEVAPRTSNILPTVTKQGHRRKTLAGQPLIPQNKFSEVTSMAVYTSFLSPLLAYV